MKETQSSQHLKRVRAFIAVNLPVPIMQKVGELQRQLRDRSRQAGLKVGWVAPTNMHVTLKFLAEIPEETVWAVRDVLRERLTGRAGFGLRVRGAGAFPNPQKPRVLWVGIECGGGELERLATDVDGWLEELGFAREKRAFNPHLTLGRVKVGAADVLEGLPPVELGECSVTEVVVYRSVLRREGAVYTALAQIPLGRPPSSSTAVAASPTQPEPEPEPEPEELAEPSGTAEPIEE
jgi:RNA 2',3'-cyclic 3'-phosphodiesterase